MVNNTTVKRKAAILLQNKLNCTAKKISENNDQVGFYFLVLVVEMGTSLLNSGSIKSTALQPLRKLRISSTY